MQLHSVSLNHPPGTNKDLWIDLLACETLDPAVTGRFVQEQQQQQKAQTAVLKCEYTQTVCLSVCFGKNYVGHQEDLLAPVLLLSLQCVYVYILYYTCFGNMGLFTQPHYGDFRTKCKSLWTTLMFSVCVCVHMHVKGSVPSILGRGAGFVRWEW